MPEIIGDGFEVRGNARIDFTVDEADLRRIQGTFRTSGLRWGDEIGKAVVKGLGPINEALKDIVDPKDSRAARDAFVAGFLGTFKQVLAGSDNMADGIQADIVAAVNAMETGFLRASKGGPGSIGGATRATNEFEDSLGRLLVQAKKLPESFNAIFGAITADVQLMAREISKGIVGEQSTQQLRGIQKRQADIAAQQAKVAAREQQAILQAGLREQEQTRQQGHRLTLVEEKSAASQINSVLNSSLQEQLIQEKGHQQRRSALVRSGLDALRSAYRAAGSGIESAFRSIFSGVESTIRSAGNGIVAAARAPFAAMRAEAISHEDQLTAVSRSGLVRRREQTEQIMRQQTATMRREQGIYLATQQKLDKGVLGGLFGTSAFGAGLRTVGLGAGAFGLTGLISQMGEFESNLATFAVMNDEIQRSPELLEAVREKAFALGKDLALPGVSASDAAAAITALGKTGLSMTDSMEGARGSLLLARIAGVDFTESARTIGSTLNAIGLEGEDAIAVVDGITTALRLGGGTTFDELRQAGAQATLVFTNAFRGVEEPIDIMNNLNATLALFAKNTLRGSDAGTSLKTFIASLSGLSDKSKGLIEGLTRMAGPEFGGGNFLFRENGQGRKFAETIDLVRTSFAKLEPKERAEQMRQIFGNDAIRAMQVFFNASEGEIENLVAEMEKASGFTLRLAKAQNQGIKAGVDAFVSVIETIFTKAFSKFNKPIGNFIVGVGNIIGTLADDPRFEVLRKALLGIAVGLTAIAVAKAAVETLRLLSGLLGGMVSPLGLLALGFATIGAVLFVFYKRSKAVRDVVDSVKEGFLGLVDNVVEVVEPILRRVANSLGGFVDRVGKAIDGIVSLVFKGDFTKEFAKAFGVLEDAPIVKGILRVRDTVLGLFNAVARGKLTDEFRKSFGGIKDPPIITSILKVRTGIIGLFTLISGGKLTKEFAKAFDLKGDSPLVKTVLGIREGIIDAFNGAKEAVGKAIGGILDFVGDIDIGNIFGTIAETVVTVFSAIGRVVTPIFTGIRDAILSIDLGTLLTNIGNIASGVFNTVAGIFQTIADFFVATVRTIKEVGVLEGLRQAVLVPLEAIGGFVGDIVGDIDWEGIFTSIPAALFNVFRTIGDNIARFIASDQFLATVGIAIGVVATVLGSSAAGLVTGLLEGLRDSDAAGRIGEFLLEAFTKGIELAFAALNPVTLIRKLFTDPLGSGLGAAALVVQAIFAVKIVGLFVAGFKRISASARGFSQIPRVFREGLGGMQTDLRKVDTAARTNQAALKLAEKSYGSFATKGVKVAADANRFFGTTLADGVGKLKTTATQSATTAGVWDRLGGSGRTAASGTQRFTDQMSALNDRLQITQQIVGGLMAGGGIGVALGTSNAAAKVAGVTSALAGLATQVTTTFQVFKTQGLAAGLASGAIGAIVTLAAAIAAFFVARSQENKRAEEEMQAIADGYASAFKQIVDAANGSKAALKLEFMSTINDTTNSSMEGVREAFDVFRVSLREGGAAMTGSNKDFEGWRKGLVDDAESSERALETLREQYDNFKTTLRTRGRQISSSDRAALEQMAAVIAAEEERLEKQREGLRNIDAARRQYQEILEVADEELLIRNNLKKLEEERLSFAQRVVDKVREESSAYSTVEQQLLDIIRLEDGRLERDKQRGVREAARGVAAGFLPTTDAEGRKIAPEFNLAAALDLTNITEQADATRRALEPLEGVIAGIASVLAKGTPAEYAAGIEEMRRQLVETFTDKGLGVPQATAIADAMLEPFEQNTARALLLAETIRSQVDTVEAQLKARKIDINLRGEFEDTEARQLLQDFLNEPSQITVDALLPLDIPQELLAAFIEDPNNKTLDLILDDLIFREELAELQRAAREPQKMPVKVSASDDDLRAIANDVATMQIPPIYVPVRPKFSLEDWEGARAWFGGSSGLPGNEYGSVIAKPTLSWLGEKNKKEVVIPLTMPRRAAQLYEESGLAAVLAKAGVGAPGAPGAPGGAGAPGTAVQTRTITRGPDMTDTNHRLALAVEEIRSLRTALESMGNDTFVIESRDPERAADAIYRKRRRKRLGLP